ncbi:MAG: hypothetical protein ABEJ02_00330 [Candidatus Paceibacteria bacterium]
MPEFQQKNIKQYLQEYNIDEQQLTPRFLQDITSTIHDRNDLVIELEKESDEYKQEQIITDIQELDQKIEQDFQEFNQDNS